MNSYLAKVKAELKNPFTATIVIVVTIARIIYGWAWLSSGLGKATSGWLSFAGGKSYKLIETMAANMTPPKARGFDPLYINKLWIWISTDIFNQMPGLTDFLVPVTEILIGVLFILGFRVLWGALVAIFLSLQFIAAGSANNFGYLITSIAATHFTKYVELLGVSGFLRGRKGKKLIDK